MNCFDEDMMKIAINLAKEAEGKTSPNPLVGAVVVKDKLVIGQGYHHKAGSPHAEVNAINDVAGSTDGATIYVTLEPCSTVGRTPACTDLIIKSRIKKVVIGSLDPNPAHAGNGVKILEKHGIEVITGILEDECEKLNEAFFKWIVTKKPFVILKMAMTLDGKIATKEGQSKWITGAEARARVQRLRNWADAILVGGETIRQDDPSLTVREFEVDNQPKVAILSSKIKREETKYFKDGRDVFVYKLDNDFTWQDLLLDLGKNEVTALLIEGGGEVAASALFANAVDKVEFHIAPKILGGADSRSVVGGENPNSLVDALNLIEVNVESCGSDIIVTGYVGDK